MNDLQQSVEALLVDIKPLLAQNGRDIVLLDANDEKARFRLVGFCGNCACGDSYKEGIREMVEEKFPNLNVEFE